MNSMTPMIFSIQRLQGHYRLSERRGARGLLRSPGSLGVLLALALAGCAGTPPGAGPGHLRPDTVAPGKPPALVDGAAAMHPACPAIRQPADRPRSAAELP